MNVRLTKEQKIRVLNSDDIYSVMQRILLRENKIDRNREHFWVLGLANNHRILFIELISKGTINKAPVEPMEVFSLALQKRAVRIVLCHNHPSGELQPSDADINITDKLIQTGILVNTPVLDHLIISEKSYLSFSDTHLLDEIKKSTRYVLPYKRIDMAKKEAKEKGIKKGIKEGIKEGKIEIARQCLKEELEMELIVKLTGLTEKEVEKIKIEALLG